MKIVACSQSLTIAVGGLEPIPAFIAPEAGNTLGVDVREKELYLQNI